MALFSNLCWWCILLKITLRFCHGPLLGYFMDLALWDLFVERDSSWHAMKVTSNWTRLALYQSGSFLLLVLINRTWYCWCAIECIVLTLSFVSKSPQAIDSSLQWTVNFSTGVCQIDILQYASEHVFSMCINLLPLWGCRSLDFLVDLKHLCASRNTTCACGSITWHLISWRKVKIRGIAAPTGC